MMPIQAPMTAPDSALHFTMIFIDDTELERTLAQRKCIEVLEKSGYSYSMQFADNGLDGWNLCNANRFSVYVVDKHMPGMDGIEVCRRILEKDPTAQVILYTARIADEIKNSIRQTPPPKGVEVIPKNISMLISSLEERLKDFRRSSTAGRKNSANGEKG